MRSRVILVGALFALACGTSRGGGGPVADAGVPPGADAGTGNGGDDAGVVGPDAGVDAGTADAGGAIDAGPADAGIDGGTATSDCPITPQTPGAPSVFRLVNQDLTAGACFPGGAAGTGHIEVSFQGAFQPHTSNYAFVDPATATQVGSFTGTRLFLIDQISGFIGSECLGATCQQDYVVLSPTGGLRFRSPLAGNSNGVQANDPTGGMIHARLSNAGATVLLDAIDGAGAVRWTQALPETFGPGESGNVRVGVDREGNVLALWKSSLGRFGATTWAGEWFDPAGTPGAVFQALPAGAVPDAFFERVGNGLFLAGFAPAAGAARSWLGQFEPLATSLTPVPAWLAARPDVTLHMVHDGTGYALLPPPGPSATCEQDVEVISPSGQMCGTASFAVGGGACTTSSITVGFEGTVIQQLPREREAACTAGGHQCDCTYRFWPGIFR